MSPTIETSRLLLREWRVEDAVDYHALQSDPKVKRFLGTTTNRDVNFYRQSIANKMGKTEKDWVVMLRESGCFIGCCGFMDNWQCEGWELYILLASSYIHKGYGKEIGKALIQYGFEVFMFDTIFGVIDSQHCDSIALCKHLGMELRPRFQFKKSGKPVVVYAIQKQSCSSTKLPATIS